jgi:5'(3')-deoxyribonucleotidase
VKPTIYFDMDGVFVDFVGEALKVHGLPFSDPWPLVPNDPLGRRMDIEAAYGLSHDDFWAPINAIGPEFWLNLPPLEDGLALYEQLTKKYLVLVCTTPARDASSSSGKILWLQRHFGSRFRDYTLAPKKWRLAHGHALLIDDSDDNVVEFRRHHGHAWLLPRPWNSGGGVVNRFTLEQTIAKVYPRGGVPKELQEKLTELTQEYGERIMRVAYRNSFSPSRWDCMVCGVIADSVMLTDEVWKHLLEAFSLEGREGLLCTHCMHRGLGRPLTHSDLRPCPLSAPMRLGMEIGASASDELRSQILQDTDWRTTYWRNAKELASKTSKR